MNGSSNTGLVVTILAGSGAVLMLAGAVIVGLGTNTLVGAALLVAGFADVIAAFVVRARLR
jgi:hypothetical protein